MIPAFAEGKFLIVLHDRSKLDIVQLDSSSGGVYERTVLSYSALVSALQGYLGIEVCNGKVMGVMNGVRTGSTYELRTSP